MDEDEIYNNPNLHSEEQDELEISDGKYTLLRNHMNIVLKYRIYFIILFFFRKFSIELICLLILFKIGVTIYLVRFIVCNLNNPF